MGEWFHNVWLVFTTYPEFFAGAVGILLPIGFCEVLRFAYFPKDWTLKDQWKAILPIDLILSYAITHTLWHFLDHDKDPSGLLTIGSICFAMATLGVHVFGVRILLHKWPWLNNSAPPSTTTSPDNIPSGSESGADPNKRAPDEGGSG